MEIQQIEIPEMSFDVSPLFFEQLKTKHNLRFSGSEGIVSHFQNIESGKQVFASKTASLFLNLDEYEGKSALHVLTQPDIPQTVLVREFEILRNIFYFLTYNQEVLNSDGFHLTHIGLMVISLTVVDVTLMYHADEKEWVVTFFTNAPSVGFVERIIAINE